MFDYGEVLTKAWKIIWKYKILWLFGILAGCMGSISSGSGGGGGAPPAGAGSSGYQFNGGDFEGTDNFFYQFGQFLNSIPVAVYVAVGLFFLIVLVCVLPLVMMALGSFGRSGLARGIWLADAGEPVKASLLFSEGFRNFGKVFLIYLLYMLAGLLVGLLIFVFLGLPFLIFGVLTMGLGILCLMPIILPVGILLACISIPLTIFFEVWVDQSVVAMVGEDLNLLDGVKRAWQVMIGNLVHYLLMGLILYIGRAVLGLLLALPAIAVALTIVAVIGMGISLEVQAVWIAGLIIGGVALLLLILLAIVVGGGVTAYFWAAWTLTFRRLTINNPQFNRNIEIINPSDDSGSDSSAQNPDKVKSDDEEIQDAEFHPLEEDQNIDAEAPKKQVKKKKSSKKGAESKDADK